jgi:hypothetical protein
MRQYMTGKKPAVSKPRPVAKAATVRSVPRRSEIEAEIAALNEKIKRTLPELEAQADRLLGKTPIKLCRASISLRLQ